MTKILRTHPYPVLLIATLILRIATALPLERAGYMDASYALHVAENLASGNGFVEQVLWNYLDRPAGLPHPSNLYWMPLPSILIAPFFAVLGASYRVAQIPFILLALPLPLFAFYLSRRVTGRDSFAWAAALFTAFSGFYMVYWVSPDNFTVFALTASLCLYAMARGTETGGARYFFAAGLLAGLCHLSRADGLLLLLVAPMALLIARPDSHVRGAILRFTFYVLLGYLLILTPWFVRNYAAVGSPYPSAGAKTLWLTSYEELFRYRDDLTPARYLATGIGPILGSKLYAAVMNLLVIAFGDLQVFLAPFAAIGMWQLRRSLQFLPFFIYAFLLYLAMTLAFTFPSWRGSVLHSSAALLPFLAAAVPPGLDAVIQWIARRRRTWNAAQARQFFLVGFASLAIFFSILFYAQGIFGSVIGGPSTTPLWNQRDAEYIAVARWLDANAASGDVVMVPDPPSFYNISRHPAIVIPTDGTEAILLAARQYRARYLVIQYDYANIYKDLYAGETTMPELTRVADFRDALERPVTLYQFNSKGSQ